VGEHTREILAELGLSGREIDALAARRVVGDGSSRPDAQARIPEGDA
jgi:hypothetical protein